MNPQELPTIPVLFEDDQLLVINKPAGITVNRADTTRHELTVQDWVENYLKLPKASDTTDTFIQRAGIVHRLDKETSGILLIAKTPVSFEALQAQFKERKVKKTYLALAHGTILPKVGEIRVPVGRLPWNRKQFGVVAGGKEALTLYSVRNFYKSKSSNDLFSLVELHPYTGRTHQIRVHLKYLGYPIVADFLYAGRKTSREDRKELERVFLHAHAIEFFHPTTGDPIQLQSELPKDLTDYMDLLQELSSL